MLELAVLGLLHEAPLHGYELRQRLKATLGTFRAFSYGSLYPTLRRMKEQGWICEDEGDAEVVAGRMCGMDLPIRTSTLQHQFPYSTLAEQLLTRHVS